RMLRNLIGIELESKNHRQALPYLDMLLTLAPEESSERLSRALLRFQEEDLAGAASDVDWLLKKRPPGIFLDRLEGLKARISEMQAADG
ncbi:MAG: tetratricopeptide repeat protein, partial [Verrucomicrobiota bacterium]